MVIGMIFSKNIEASWENSARDMGFTYLLINAHNNDGRPRSGSTNMPSLVEALYLRHYVLAKGVELRHAIFT